jgi:ketosteroid isomerase-like protein
VLVRGKWQLIVAREEVGGWFTLLFRKLPDGWKVTHDHTSK